MIDETVSNVDEVSHCNNFASTSGLFAEPICLATVGSDHDEFLWPDDRKGRRHVRKTNARAKR